jgi:hypothetical protein
MQPTVSMAEPFPSPSTPGPTREYLQIDGWVYAAVEEYKSLRTESLDSMKVLLSYGVSSVVLILTAGLSIIDKDTLSTVDAGIFLLLIPTTIFFIVVIWAGEVARMYRAGAFLMKHELIVSEYVGTVSRPALSWENWLSQNGVNNEAPHKKLYMQHYSVLAMFLFLYIVSITIGNYKLGGIHIEYLIIIDIVEASSLACLALLTVFLLRCFHPSIARTASEVISRLYTSGKEMIFPKRRKTLMSGAE